MSDALHPEDPPILQAIKNVRKLDRWIRRLSYTAWGTTILIIAVLTAYEIVNISLGNRVVSGAAGPGLNDLWLTLYQWSPVIRTIGVFTLVVGLFSTALVFLRLRTASLAEIRERLATIEKALIERGD